MGFFQDKIAIITGGASGIGKELGRLLAQDGAHVTLADVNAQALEKVVASFKESGLAARGAVADVTSRERMQALVEETAAKHSRLDYLFNNAGIGVAGEVRDYAYEDWSDVIGSNVYGVINGVHAAYPVMVKQGFGHIVNTSSIAGLIPFPFETSYCAAKHAIVGLSLALRAEARDLGVKVSVACPGFINTPIWQTNRTVNIDRQKALAALPVHFSSVQRCAREILAGVRKNKPIIVITRTAKNLWLLQRLSPATMLRFLAWQMKKNREARME
jgi:NAD(P)-dependent dehydrogenase (short-subunit alcohol dehydrogenase family)